MKSVQIRSYFWSVFSCIRTEYRDLRNKFPCSVRMQKNTDQKKLRIWKLFTQCMGKKLYSRWKPTAFFWFRVVVVGYLWLLSRYLWLHGRYFWLLNCYYWLLLVTSRYFPLLLVPCFGNNVEKLIPDSFLKNENWACLAQ